VLKKVALGSVVAAMAFVGIMLSPAAASAGQGHATTVIATVKPHQATALCSYTSQEPSLRAGSTNRTAIKQAQCELNWAFAFATDTDYGNGPRGGLKVDGDFGRNTDAATRAFQSCAGVGVDGSIGPNTWSKLDFWVNSLGYCS
jgi:zinc D-Ala-D-Ala carboxypeptidase